MDEFLAQTYFEDLKKNPIPGWKVEKVLGNGASAAVFSASSEKHPESALKVFDKELINKFGEINQLERINRELRLIGKEHPHLVKIYQGGKCNSTGYVYIAMEFINARALSDVISEFPNNNIKTIISQLASAVRFLENNDVVHRDIKPQNIVIDKSFTNATLLDLGVIRPITNSDLTDNSNESPFIATKRYAPPEFLLRKEEQSPDGFKAISIYQLGGVLHDLIMKKPLFDNYSSPDAVLMNAVQNVEPIIDNQDVDPDLRALAKNCLVKDPNVRLTLVDMNNFDFSSQGDNFQKAKKRVKDRLVRMSVNENGIDTDNQIDRLKKENISKEVSEKIRDHIVRHVKEGLLPPCTTTYGFGKDKDPITKFEFKISEKYLLPNGMTIILKYCFIDLNEKIIEIKVAAVNTCVNIDDCIDSNFYTVYTGKADVSVMTGLFELIIIIVDHFQERHEQYDENQINWYSV